MSFPQAPFAHLTAGIRAVANGVPVFAVARIVDAEKAEELLSDGTADFVRLVRPLIADPEWPRKAKAGRTDDIRRCISCNVGCRGGPHRGVQISCLVNPAVGFERRWGVGRIAKAPRARRVVVAGGGPAGLKAAETAALRGHHVTLLEASDHLGGQVLVAAAAMPYRDEFADATRFLERQIRGLKVEVKTGLTADLQTIAGLEPDAVVVATGSKPGRPNIPGAGLPHVFNAHDAITTGIEGHRVLLVDSGEADWKCLTTAENLAAAGHEVTIASPVGIGAEIDAFSRPPLLRRLGAAGVRFLEHRALVAIAPDTVTLRHGWTWQEEKYNDFDAVVLSWYGVAVNALSQALEKSELDVYVIGDALTPRRAIDAIWDGFRIGNEL